MIQTLLALWAAAAVNIPPEEDEHMAGAVIGALAAAGFDLPSDTKPTQENSVFRIVSATQDYGRPTPDACCHTFTPLRIGQRTFARGIGAHANGRIAVELKQPMKRFLAQVGIDNNDDTQGVKGSAQFVVMVDGQERFRSPICRGGEEPVRVEVDLTGASNVELLVNDAGDGINYDQADWAEAILETADGKQHYLGDAFRQPLFSSPPTSFLYDGKDCWSVFEHWTRTQSQEPPSPGIACYSSTWTDPDTGFRATLHARLLEPPAAVEFQWEFENKGNAPSAVISEIRSIDFQAPSRPGQITLHSCSGGLTGDLEERSERTGFELAQTALGQKTLTVNGGRSSNGDLPFFALTGLQDGYTLVSALAWSGQWRAEGRFVPERGTTAFSAGIEPARFRLPPGESILLPAGLLLPFRGDVQTGANRLRQLLQIHYQATLDGQRVEPPVSFNSWFVFDNRVDAAMLCALADEAAPLGIEYFCLDSGWFDGDFPNGVGNWTIHKGKFPNGLKTVADHVHALGMKFGLWFEPERVADGTRWQQEHADLLIGPNLMDLGNPRAREVVLQMLDSTITDVGVDWIRYDFNIDPLESWNRAEGDDAKGLRQIRYINGVYAVWAELMRRHPGLLIEQCASGGRRIDLQTIRYGHTYWKSDDTFNQPLMRFHETGGNQFLLGGHLNTNYCRYKSQDEILALFAGPLGFGVDFRALTADQKAAVKQAVEAYKKIRRFINADYYPLFVQAKTDLTWSGWAFIDLASQEGFLAVYRPEASPYEAASVSLSGLDPKRTYELQNLMTGQIMSKSGADLGARFSLALEPGHAAVWAFAAK